MECNKDEVYAQNSSVMHKKTYTLKPNTFWTYCKHCKMQYEYIRKYVGSMLLCANCRESFHAIEVPAPNGSTQWNSNRRQSSQNNDNNTPATIRKRSYASMKAGIVSKGGPPSEVPSSAKKGKRLFKQKRSADGVKEMTSKRPMSELSALKSQNMLMDKALSVIHKHLNERKITAAAINSSNNMESLNEKKAENENCEIDDAKQQSKDLMDMDNIFDNVEDVNEGLVTTVPGSDFHNFDKDRTEQSFGDNQVWAAYENDDGMPRLYAMIHSVLSTNPFKIRISWLNSKTNNEIAPLNWVSSGFLKTCGELQLGKHVVFNTLNSFSHKVKFTKGAKGSIHIYPNKGDVWALYRNWSADWNELTPNDVVHKYDMVKVLENYDEEQGVIVAPLTKVHGFKTVFLQHLNPDKFITIKKEELFRFSHQIPFYLLTGNEGPNAPKDCLELDPAATPLEFLKEIEEEVIVEEMEENADDIIEDIIEP